MPRRRPFGDDGRIGRIASNWKEVGLLFSLNGSGQRLTIGTPKPPSRDFIGNRGQTAAR